MTSRLQTLSLFILRLVAGIYFVNLGLSAWTPGWSLAPFIANPTVFPVFYHAVAASALFSTADIAMKFVFLSIGIVLVLGIFVRLVSFLGMLLMLFLYFPGLAFPFINTYLIVASALLVLLAFRAGEILGLGHLFHFSKY